MIPLDRVRELLAAATPSPIDVHRCDADGGDIDYQLQRGAGHGGTVLGYASDRDGSPRAKADATLWSHAPDLARDVLTLAAALETAQRERDRLTACLARANATIEETERARYAAEEQRDTARSALDGLVAAVREEREAERGHAAVRADDASRGRHLRAAEAAVDKARHATDALISAAPAPTTVPAEVVRAYLRADARSATGTHADATALAAARTALDAALATTTTTPKESR